MLWSTYINDVTIILKYKKYILGEILIVSKWNYYYLKQDQSRIDVIFSLRKIIDNLTVKFIDNLTVRMLRFTYFNDIIKKIKNEKN